MSKGRKKRAPCLSGTELCKGIEEHSVNMKKLLKEVVSSYNTRGWNLRVRKVK